MIDEATKQRILAQDDPPSINLTRVFDSLKTKKLKYDTPFTFGNLEVRLEVEGDKTLKGRVSPEDQIGDLRLYGEIKGEFYSIDLDPVSKEFRWELPYSPSGSSENYCPCYLFALQ